MIMAHGYMADDINVPDLLDLLDRALAIVRNASRMFMDKPEPYHSGEIELPGGDKQQISISLKEPGKYTMMLPEDH